MAVTCGWSCVGRAVTSIGYERSRRSWLQPDIILASTTRATAALQWETQTIPIVFANLSDPVASGLVERLDRPSGNITGFADFGEVSLGGKWLELLSEIAPGLKRAAIMFNPDTSPASLFLPSLETAARALKVALSTAPVHSEVEIETAIVALGREPGGGLVVLPDVFTSVHRVPIILAAAQNNVPAVYTQSYYARDGGLLSYGVDRVDIWRRAASYVDRILRGAKPAELPVQLSVKYEMAVRGIERDAVARAAGRADHSRDRAARIRIRRMVWCVRPRHNSPPAGRAHQRLATQCGGLTRHARTTAHSRRRPAS
jgi:ABC-type uncharacterized transport system substrate-binding protein